MTDQEIVAGRGEIAEDSGALGLNLYGYAQQTVEKLFSSGNLGQGSGAVAWLAGDFFGSGESGIAQLWDNNGALGLNIYLAFFTVGTAFSSGNLGQGSGAVAWLTGDFLGAGTIQIAQLWDNKGALAVNIYQGNHNGTVEVTGGNADLGQGPGALAWLTGDFTGSGRAQIAQPWDNHGTLGLNVYFAEADGGVQTAFSSGNMGQGSGAVAWLTGDFLGLGTIQIAQLWDNHGTLGLNIYGYNINTDTVQAVFSSGNLGQGSGAVAWLAGDFTGSGHTEIAQLWDNHGTLGLIVYRYVQDTMQTVFSDLDMGQGSRALAWLTGDFTGSGRTEIAQPWDNHGTLGLNIYGGQGDGLVLTAFSSSDMGQGSGALAWLAGNFGGGLTLIAQPWDN